MLGDAQLSSGPVPFDDDAEEDTGFRPPPHPDDRIWRHPSEMKVYPIVPVGAPGAPSRPRLLLERARPWVSVVAAGAAGAVLAGVAVVWLGIGERVVERPVTERVALNPVVTPGLSDAAASRVRELTGPGVVAIGSPTATGPDDGNLHGSGVVVRDDGIVVTSASLVSAGDVYVRQPDGTVVTGEVLGVDPGSGLAVLDLEGFGYSSVVEADASDLVAREAAYNVTARSSGGNTVTGGRVGTPRRYVGPGGGALDGVEVSGPTRDLALGSALADPQGAVVGVTTAADHDGWYVMPIEVVDKVVADILADGRVHTAVLGTENTDVAGPTGDIVAAEVASVVADSPAANGGLVAGDIVLAIDGRPITSAADLMLVLRTYAPGDEIDLKIARADGSRTTLVIPLAEQPVTP
jgi:S1-C subfamily serine protease